MTANNSQVSLAKQAADGQDNARREVSDLVEPIVSYQTQKFCKRFCKEQRFRYTCSLPEPYYGAAPDAPLCEWGNASYGWMLDDLSNEKRLRKFTGANGAKLYDYVFTIANSLPFYERWKDWRFSRRVHVPTYIQSMAAEAKDVFYAIRQGEELEFVAQKLRLSIDQIQQTASRIITELTKRNRLHIINVDKTQSLSEINQDSSDHSFSDIDISVEDHSVEQSESEQILHAAWQTLSGTEQYVLEAMLIDEQDANDILTALHKLEIQINPSIQAQDTNRQHLYYFKRKTLEKLRGAMQK